jgi:carboxylesterase type B
MVTNQRSCHGAHREQPELISNMMLWCLASQQACRDAIVATLQMHQVGGHSGHLNMHGQGACHAKQVVHGYTCVHLHMPYS